MILLLVNATALQVAYKCADFSSYFQEKTLPFKTFLHECYKHIIGMGKFGFLVRIFFLRLKCFFFFSSIVLDYTGAGIRRVGRKITCRK